MESGGSGVAEWDAGEDGVAGEERLVELALAGGFAGVERIDWLGI